MTQHDKAEAFTDELSDESIDRAPPDYFRTNAMTLPAQSPND